MRGRRGTPRTPVRRPEGRRNLRGLGAAGLSLALATLWLVPLGGYAVGPSPRTGASDVLAITQSANPFEQGTFTVSIQLSDPSNVQLVYFLFCQLTNAQCYAPVAMTLHGTTNTYTGTTQAMSTYHGMVPGIRAGYNITIGYANGTNVTEPTVPNHFANLSVDTAVDGAYYFVMSVRDQVYGLTGTVTDQATGTGLSGANVSLSGSAGHATTLSGANGAYSFTGLSNGTYSLSVTYRGYRIGNTSVTFAGHDLVQDLAMANNSSYTHSTGPGGSGGGFFSTTTGMVTVALAAVALLLIGVAAVWRARSRKAERSSVGPAPATDAEPPTRPSG